jgi:hypothetical protein
MAKFTGPKGKLPAQGLRVWATADRKAEITAYLLPAGKAVPQVVPQGPADAWNYG